VFETYILYELDKHIGMTAVKILTVKQCASTAVNVFYDVTPCHIVCGSGHFWIVISIQWSVSPTGILVRLTDSQDGGTTFL